MNDLMSRFSGHLTASDVEMQRQSAVDVSSMTTFMEEADSVTRDINAAKASLSELARIHDNSRAATKAGDVKSAKQHMEQQVTKISLTAAGIQRQVKELKLNNAQLARAPGYDPSSAEARMRVTRLDSIVHSLRNMMAEFRSLREKMDNDYRQTVERQLRMLTGEEPSEDFLDQVISSGTSENLIRKAIQGQSGKEFELEAIKGIQERQGEVDKITKELMGLLRLFEDMAALVEAQDDLVLEVEDNVIKTVDHVDKGNKHIGVALDYKRNTRKWQIITAGVLVLIIAAVILYFVVNK